MTKADILDIIKNTIDNKIYELEEYNKIASINESLCLQSSVIDLEQIKNDLRYYIINEIKIERKDGYT